MVCDIEEMIRPVIVLCETLLDKEAKLICQNKLQQDGVYFWSAKGVHVVVVQMRGVCFFFKLEWQEITFIDRTLLI